MIAWDKISLPKTHGGMGVLNIQIHNQTLLMKFLHKFLNREDIPWVQMVWETYYSNTLPGDRSVGSFWWKALLKLFPKYKEVALCNIGQGDTAFFGSDRWHGQPLCNQFPELHSFSINPAISVRRALEHQDMSRLFHRPFSQIAYQQFLSLQEIILNRSINQSSDQWFYPWTSHKYSSMKMYKQLIHKTQVHHIFKDIWSTSCRLRHIIFFWLLLHDRINTRNMLQRRSMHLQTYICALCSDNSEETCIHLFWNCPFAIYCWDQILPERRRGISAIDEITLAMESLPSDIALEIIIACCWGIWSCRNDKIFRSAPSHLGCWKHYVKEGLWAAQIKAKPQRADTIKNWIEQHL